jgi:hypothetical protein
MREAGLRAARPRRRRFRAVTRDDRAPALRPWPRAFQGALCGKGKGVDDGTELKTNFRRICALYRREDQPGYFSRDTPPLFETCIFSAGF